MDEKDILRNLREEEEEEEENQSEETKILISSLPWEIDYLGNKLFKYQGYWYYEDVLQSIPNIHLSFQPQETDIVVASFYKSGTTWLKALTFALVQRSKHSLEDHHHPLLSHNPHEIVPYLELDLYLNSSKPDLTKFLSSSSSSSSPRLFSTHMSLDALKLPLKKSPCKVVYVCRNVKDVLVSLWCFLNANKGVEWGDFSQNEKIIRAENYSFKAIFESFCNGVTLHGPFWDHAQSYWRGSLEDPKHFLFMRYEELKAEPRTQVKRLAEFLDCPFTKEEEDSGTVDKILELCSLSNLSSLEINKTGSLGGVDYKTYFRKGQVGDWKSYMTSEMVNKIDMIVEEKLKGSGLKF
ncbi:P-loop containing nucleoside triphosphate hydrolase [Arabidopsis suecica]|uniref:Sulfotransferase n=1 Tax=Arabidopsis suecica TaxID=45249 RepID=A0A8T2CCC5_ARASU|nr:P-loop containing nucleoside triphosphate hydrolase [Arabidopsis suecica]